MAQAPRASQMPGNGRGSQDVGGIVAAAAKPVARVMVNRLSSARVGPGLEIGSAKPRQSGVLGRHAPGEQQAKRPGWIRSSSTRSSAPFWAPCCSSWASVFSQRRSTSRSRTADRATRCPSPRAPSTAARRAGSRRRVPIGTLLASADADDGADGQARKCQSCHTFNEGGANGQGPNLWGVVGRPIASHEGFAYSRRDDRARGGGRRTGPTRSSTSS